VVLRPLSQKDERDHLERIGGSAWHRHLGKPLGSVAAKAMLRCKPFFGEPIVVLEPSHFD